MLGKSDGQRSLEGYSPWGHKESGTTEQLSARVRARTHTHTHTEAINEEDLKAPGQGHSLNIW